MSLLNLFFPKKRMPRRVVLPESFSEYKLNVTRDSPDERDFIKSALPVVSLPAKLSYREFVTVKQQGRQGSCGSHNAVTGKEMVGLLRGEKLAGIPLSEEFHYWVVRQKEYFNTFPEDSGQNGRSAMKVLARQGVCPEKLCPYDDQKFNDRPGVFAFGFSKFWKISRYERCMSVEAIKTALFNKEAVWFGVPIQERFRTNKGQIINYEKGVDQIGGHAIEIIGYDDYLQALEFVNSWGRTWGDNGFGYFSYDYLREVDWFDCWSFS